MDWTVFSYSLPATSRSSPRVSVWRRLSRLGTISPTSGVYVLPARDECLEAFQWLAQEVRQAGGEALVMRVEQFEGLTDTQLIELFNLARGEEYRALDKAAAELEQSLVRRKKSTAVSAFQDALEKLRRRHAEIERTDYFDSPDAAAVAARLDRIAQALTPASSRVQATIAQAAIAEYRGRCWVTRPRPHVDRLACAWLIRRFVDPNAVIRYAHRTEPDEIAFDMERAAFGHQGNLCTFEVMLKAFGLLQPTLRALAEIVHEIDLRDGQYAHPETWGVDQILKGWLRAGLSDADLESHGIALFEGLFTALSSTWRATRGKKK